MLARDLYPPIEPYAHGHLDVGDGHRLYWETCGNPSGKAVVVLHGGPGGWCVPDLRRAFDPQHYRIVLFDQRNCGRSLPHASEPGVSLTTNTTWHLVHDMEQLREHLGIETWMVFGGSWGSTLGLAYAQRFPSRVSELVLRGIFMLRPFEIAWFYQSGASLLQPDRWERFVEEIPPDERDDLLSAYGRRLVSHDGGVRQSAARAWAQWEGSSVSLLPDDDRVTEFGDPEFAVAFARIEHHYFVHNGWLAPDQLLHDVDTIRHIPAVIVQGRYDLCTPAVTAWQLHRAWPEAEFHLVEDAGHAQTEPGILTRLVQATDRLAGVAR
jgi:proline iminopeptidase